MLCDCEGLIISVKCPKFVCPKELFHYSVHRYLGITPALNCIFRQYLFCIKCINLTNAEFHLFVLHYFVHIIKNLVMQLWTISYQPELELLHISSAIFLHSYACLMSNSNRKKNAISAASFTLFSK